MTSKSDLRDEIDRLTQRLRDLIRERDDARRHAELSDQGWSLYRSAHKAKLQAVWRAKSAETKLRAAEAKLRAIDEVQHPKPAAPVASFSRPSVERMDEIAAEMNALADRITNKIAKAEEERIEDELIKLGWTPPAGSQAASRAALKLARQYPSAFAPRWYL